jgi:hypothetical protein
MATTVRDVELVPAQELAGAPAHGPPLRTADSPSRSPLHLSAAREPGKVNRSPVSLIA